MRFHYRVESERREDIGNRNVFRVKLAKVKNLPDDRESRTKKVFVEEEERPRIRRRMKEYWRKRKYKRKYKKPCNPNPQMAKTKQ